MSSSSGAGKIARPLRRYARRREDYRITVADRSNAQLAAIATSATISTQTLDITDDAALTTPANRALRERTQRRALPSDDDGSPRPPLRSACTHYLDLTEDVEPHQARQGAQRDRREDRAHPAMWSLAPGFISIVAKDLRRRGSTRWIRLQHARRRPAAISVQRAQLQPHLEHGRRHQRIYRTLRGDRRGPAAQGAGDGGTGEFAAGRRHLRGLQHLRRLGTLCETLDGKVRTLNYRTIRYPGHATIMKALLNDLDLRHRRDVLKDIWRTPCRPTPQDVVVIFVTVTGHKDGRAGAGDLRQQGLQRGHLRPCRRLQAPSRSTTACRHLRGARRMLADRRKLPDSAGFGHRDDFAGRRLPRQPLRRGLRARRTSSASGRLVVTRRRRAGPPTSLRPASIRTEGVCAQQEQWPKRPLKKIRKGL